MNHPYSQLLSSQPQIVQETANSYLYVTERHLQAVWFEQRYFKDLKTIHGETIEVISREFGIARLALTSKRPISSSGAKSLKGTLKFI